MGYRLNYTIDGNLDQAGKAIASLPKTSTASKLVAVGATVAVAGFAAAAAASAALLAAYEKQSAVERKVVGVLGAQGEAAKVSANQAFELAKGLASVTTFSDEALLGAEAILLGSARLTRAQLALATETTANLSVRLGTDLKAASLLVGKALSAGGDGLTALSRAGIKVEEKEREYVASLFDSGQIEAGINAALSVMSSGTDGLARQVAQGTGIFTILGNSLSDLAQTLGGIIAPEAVAVANLLSKNLAGVAVFQMANDIKIAVTATLVAVAQTVIETANYIRSLGPQYGKIIKGVFTGNGDLLREGAAKIGANAEIFFGKFGERFAENFDLAAQTVVETSAQFTLTQEAIARQSAKTQASIAAGANIKDDVFGKQLKALQEENETLKAILAADGDLKLRQVRAEYRNELLTRELAARADELSDLEENFTNELARQRFNADLAAERETIERAIYFEQRQTLNDLALQNEADHLERMAEIRAKPKAESLARQAAFFQELSGIRANGLAAQEAATQSLATATTAVDFVAGDSLSNIFTQIAQLVENAKGGVGREKTVGEKIIEVILIKAKSLAARLQNLKTINDIWSAIIALICNIIIHIEEALAINRVGLVHFADGMPGGGSPFEAPVVASYSPGEIVIDEKGSDRVRRGGRLGRAGRKRPQVALTLNVPGGLDRYLTIRRVA